MERQRQSVDDRLRSQIETTNARVFSTESIEARIAAALLQNGEFHENITAAELEVILRNVVYVMFERQKVAGMDVGLVHNVPIMSVTIEKGAASIEFVVHIHKPIVVFLEFAYTLINHPDAEKDLCLEEGSLRISEKTRRFDLKAKAALAALNVSRMAQQELAKPAEIIAKTLPDQLRQQGIGGTFQQIGLQFNETKLCVLLRGEFAPLQDGEETAA